MLATRAQILSEIKRTAATNGGKPLGSRRFELETGVKTYDWLGKFWARWGDALVEAGFKPNELRGSFDGLDLLAKYAGLAQQLGRLPTSRDLQLQHRQSGAFPDHKVFDRFGNKRGLVSEVMKYCQERAELNSVAVMCGEYLHRAETSTAEAAPVEELGYVYLIKHGARREYKIGCTNNALRREGEIATELPEKVQPIHVITTDDPSGIEAYWHRRFADKRKNGEWFGLNTADVRAFKRRRFM